MCKELLRTLESRNYPLSKFASFSTWKTLKFTKIFFFLVTLEPSFKDVTFCCYVQCNCFYSSSKNNFKTIQRKRLEKCNISIMRKSKPYDYSQTNLGRTV